MANLQDLIKTNGKQYKLATGVLTRLDLDTSHHYFLDEQYMPSVTSILDEAAPVSRGLIEFWKRNTKEETEAILETTRGIGSKVHGAIEALLLGQEVDMSEFSEREKKCVVSFVEWFRTFKPTDFESEQVIASKKYQYAGTLDFVGTVNGERWLVDFKTSSAIHFNYHMQVSAYKNAYEESYPTQKIDRCFILRIGTLHKGTPAKEGKLQETGSAWEFKEVNTDAFETFKNVYQTYLALHDGKIPQPENLIVYPTKIKLLA